RIDHALLSAVGVVAVRVSVAVIIDVVVADLRRGYVQRCILGDVGSDIGRRVFRHIRGRVFGNVRRGRVRGNIWVLNINRDVGVVAVDHDVASSEPEPSASPELVSGASVLITKTGAGSLQAARAITAEIMSVAT
ncbi:MAG: hypothetical protein ACJA1R_002426, partial [Flavobacteriales bacterium]